MREIEAGLLNADFIDFLKSMKKHAVESILVGGYAVVLHGYHRTTGDIDQGLRRLGAPGLITYVV